VTSAKVWNQYKELVDRFGNEFSVLLYASIEDLEEACDRRFADIMDRMRRGTLRIRPGYDGVYGKLEIQPEKKRKKL
jgi:PHP family Zn ribbon phosphoesterase